MSEVDPTTGMDKYAHLSKTRPIADGDAKILDIKEREYGASWKKRGGVGAFMMLARKWDRLEEQVQREGYDIFQAALGDDRAEGILDDIGDLRRYLLLVECHVLTMRDAKLEAEESEQTT